MKKMLSTNYSTNAFSIAMLLLRIFFGVLMMNHGYGKLTGFSQTAAHMPPFLGMSGSVTATLAIFAEFFCSLFLILGLFTRLACIPLLITMGYALFVAHGGDFFDTGEKAALFFGAYLVLLLVGPGKISVDRMIAK